MTGPFRPGELDGANEALTIVEQAQALAAARELEGAAMAADIRPSPGFSDRVMAAVAVEPLPRPVMALGWAARQGRARAAVSALADAWRLVWRGGVPLAARAQAVVLVVVLVVAAASLSGVAIAGVAGMLGHSTVISPSPPSTVTQPSEVVSPSPTRSAEPRATPKPIETAAPTATPKRSTPRPTVEPTETPEDGDDHGGGGAGSGSSGGGGEPEDVPTPQPTDGGS
jgi:uncharacterized membrane protein YgcG